MTAPIRDPGLFSTVEVEVTRRVQEGTDRYGAPVWGTETETVTGVLPQPGSSDSGGSSDLGEERPEGVQVSMTFHFPKTYTGSLRGCTVAYAGRAYRVIGDPQPYLDGNTPGPFDRAVGTEAVDG